MPATYFVQILGKVKFPAPADSRGGAYALLLLGGG